MLYPAHKKSAFCPLMTDGRSAGEKWRKSRISILGPFFSGAVLRLFSLPAGEAARTMPGISPKNSRCG